MNTRDAEKIARRIVFENEEQWGQDSGACGWSVDQEALAQLIVDELKELELKPKPGAKKAKGAK